METRRFGRTGHMSTVAIFGAAAFGQISQADADKVMEMVIEAGVNHIDVAPSYGQAEIRIGPWMPRERGRFFLGCKTMERTKEAAWKELRESLKRLQTETFDLYQCHAITTMEELDAVTMAGGALEALVQAKEQGLTRFLGITGHGLHIAATHLHALEKFDFDSVLFPLNPVMWANETYRRDAERLLAAVRARDLGAMVIKAWCKNPWGEREHSYHTWYEPFNDAATQEQAMRFALSHAGVTGLCSAGDTRLIENILNAAEKFSPLSEAEQMKATRAFSEQYAPLFV